MATPSVNPPRPRFSPRRRVLLVAVLALLAAMAALSAMGIAGFNGTAPHEMDWDGDGSASGVEIVQGYTVVAVDVSREGQRTCRSYARLRDRTAPLRVDCRVEFAPDGGGAKP
ncbi:hypothetical protein FQY83_12130 [Luteimonas marina]|uniref:EF-hand domain-containing protein n=1 Tax=Luteimonas marina TaxID=488485 RepID=A0A5C5TZY0_9GAMM|nr:hypothetical protein [Luteimonas marina]TWT19109.1 hypothetical protein FQY83_12130 [Luteimonas marina]